MPHFAAQRQSQLSNSDSTNDFLNKLEFTDGFGGLALLVAVLIPLVGVVVWGVRKFHKRKEEAALVTSTYRLLGGLNIPYVYEIRVHNATPHPLRMVEVKYWNGTAWQLTLARSSQTGDPAIEPDDNGLASVPAITSEPKKFHTFYFLKYEDSRNRTWYRRINSPDFLSRFEVWRLVRRATR